MAAEMKAQKEEETISFSLPAGTKIFERLLSLYTSAEEIKLKFSKEGLSLNEMVDSKTSCLYCNLPANASLLQFRRASKLETCLTVLINCKVAIKQLRELTKACGPSKTNSYLLHVSSTGLNIEVSNQGGKAIAGLSIPAMADVTDLNFFAQKNSGGQAEDDEVEEDEEDSVMNDFGLQFPLSLEEIALPDFASCLISSGTEPVDITVGIDKKRTSLDPAITFRVDKLYKCMSLSPSDTAKVTTLSFNARFPQSGFKLLRDMTNIIKVLSAPPKKTGGTKKRKRRAEEEEEEDESEEEEVAQEPARVPRIFVGIGPEIPLVVKFESSLIMFKIFLGPKAIAADLEE